MRFWTANEILPNSYSFPPDKGASGRTPMGGRTILYNKRNKRFRNYALLNYIKRTFSVCNKKKVLPAGSWCKCYYLIF